MTCDLSAFHFGYDGSISQFAGSPAGLEPGHATHTLARGSCTAVAGSAPGVKHVGVCKLLPRGDGTTGHFQEITVADWNSTDGQYLDAPAASWVDGIRLTCDDPTVLGRTNAGDKVAWGRQPRPAQRPQGVRDAGFNNIYPTSLIARPDPATATLRR